MNTVAPLEEKLIEQVRKHRIIYDTNLTGYRNHYEKERAWKEIAKECRESVMNCKRWWKSLRNRYRKEVTGTHGRSEDAAPTRRSRQLLVLLSFLQPIYDQTTEKVVSNSSQDTVDAGFFENKKANEPPDTKNGLLDFSLSQPERISSPDEEVESSCRDTAADYNTGCALLPEHMSQATPQVPGAVSVHLSAGSSNHTTDSNNKAKRKRNYDNDDTLLSMMQETCRSIQQLCASSTTQPRSSIEHFLLSLVPIMEKFTEQQRVHLQIQFLHAIEEMSSASVQ